MADEKVKEIDQIERDLVDDETIARINANFKYSEETSKSEENNNSSDEDPKEEQGLEIYESETAPEETASSEENSNAVESEEQETLDFLPVDETEEENKDEYIKEEPEAEISEKYSVEDEESEIQEEINEVEEQETTPIVNIPKKKPEISKQSKVKKQKPKKQETSKLPEKKPIIIIKPKHNGNNEKKELKNNFKQDDKMKSNKKQTKKDIKKTNKLSQKNNKPAKQKNSKATKPQRWMLWAGLGIIILILLIFLAFKYFPAKNANAEKTDEIVATVNGEPIYLSSINEQFDKLAPILQQIYTKEVLLNQSIDELLLIQEAAKQNVVVSDEEINSAVQDFAEQNGLTIDELKIELTKQNITMTYVQTTIKKQIIMQKFFNQTILKDISISQNEIEKYYKEYGEEYVIPEQVKVQHILRFITDNVTDEQAKTKTTEIENMLNETNFCELVDAYTEDTGSQKTCGEYVFGKGEMVAEFEQASFEMKIDEIRIVKTIYGYHLIKKLEYFPEKKMELSEVTEEIKQTLHDEKAQANFEKLMEELRQKAVIVNNFDGTTEESTGTDDSTSEETEIKPTKNLDDFAKCLTEKDATLYGASWCPHCSNQKEIFGTSLQYIKYVECADSENPQIQTPECIAAKIAGYPTWIIDGKKYTGEQTLSQLAKLTGCEQ